MKNFEEYKKSMLNLIEDLFEETKASDAEIEAKEIIENLEISDIIIIYNDDEMPVKAQVIEKTKHTYLLNLSEGEEEYQYSVKRRYTQEQLVDLFIEKV
jgi:hypothetical protein